MTLLDNSKNVKSTAEPPEVSETIIKLSHPLPPETKALCSLKFPVLRLYSLPLSVVKSAIHPRSMLPKISSKLCGQRPAETDAQNQNENITHVQECHQTVDGKHTELQENAPVEQEESRGSPPEEKEEGKVLKNCSTDPHYFLRSQNPAECPTVNTLSGFACGVPQKGLLQNKHKIRVDFKVCFFVSKSIGQFS